MTLNESIIARLHGAEGKVVIAAAGGGSLAIADLLAVPGASRTLIEATIPYDAAALADYIGGIPDQACSGKTARSMAMAAFQRARRFEPDSLKVFGIGCTAALVTDRERRGNDRCHIALQSISESREYTLVLSRDQRNRQSQEQAVTTLLLNVLAHAKGIDLPAPEFLPEETLDMLQETAEPAWRALFEGGHYWTHQGDEAPRLLFPGAFNPLHEGHREMIRIAEALTGARVLLEISTFNVDKPPLDYIEMRRRQRGIDGEFDLTFTNAPVFTTKAELFPGVTCMVGSDTLERIGAPRYYGNSVEQRDRAIATLKGQNIRFLVFGRVVRDRFVGLEDIEIPAELRALSTAVPESAFRMDVSSSQIRFSTDPAATS